VKVVRDPDSTEQVMYMEAFRIMLRYFRRAPGYEIVPDPASDSPGST
jgi:hypothetical protein